MLKLRIITAAALIPLMIWATLVLPTYGLAVLMGLFILVAAWEWTHLCGLQRPWQRVLYLCALTVLAIGLYLLLINRDVYVLRLFMGVCVAWWVWALAELVFYADVRRGWWASSAGKFLSGFFILIPAWLAPLSLHARDVGGPDLVLFMLVLVWVADSFAYFSGKAWGTTKIAPHISPGKSLQGVIGGVLGVLLVGYLYGKYFWHFDQQALIIWLMIALLTTLFSVLGDLMESRFKRAVGVKDSGTFLPGHGGVMDRIDAFTAAAPFFALAWLWWRF